MKFPRSSGILLHPTCLPGRFGVGDFGPEAYWFIDFLHETGQKIWQILPLGPTGFGDSPYQCFSAFAGNPILISPDKLVQRRLLTAADLPDTRFPEDKVDFARVLPAKLELLRRAFARFKPDADHSEFCELNAYWLDDFARFMEHKGADSQDAHRFFQFEFFRQWRELKRYCADRGIRIMGDIPIYVAGDSADVWAHPELFDREHSSGVPPDYFSETGQLWGNPVYRWDRNEKTGYHWWIERFRATLRAVDIVRLDHFRGFEAFWEVPATEKTAINGRWVKGPGARLFEALENALGELPIVAENLGVITPEVEALRHRFGFPGMSVLQFAFGDDAQAASFRPHNYPRELFAYTGTHDNDTTLGWWRSLESDREREYTKDYLGSNAREIHWDCIRAVFASVADTAIVPLQDILGLGTEARMNLPATTDANWTWRFTKRALRPKLRERLKKLTLLYDR